jgi:hypothetical protein
MQFYSVHNAVTVGFCQSISPIGQEFMALKVELGVYTGGVGQSSVNRQGRSGHRRDGIRGREKGKGK